MEESYTKRAIVPNSPNEDQSELVESSSKRVKREEQVLAQITPSVAEPKKSRPVHSINVEDVSVSASELEPFYSQQSLDFDYVKDYNLFFN